MDNLIQTPPPERILGDFASLILELSITRKVTDSPWRLSYGHSSVYLLLLLKIEDYIFVVFGTRTPEQTCANATETKDEYISCRWKIVGIAPLF